MKVLVCEQSVEGLFEEILVQVAGRKSSLGSDPAHTELDSDAPPTTSPVLTCDGCQVGLA